jgi:hypothetical protein
MCRELAWEREPALLDFLDPANTEGITISVISLGLAVWSKVLMSSFPAAERNPNHAATALRRLTEYRRGTPCNQRQPGAGSPSSEHPNRRLAQSSPGCGNSAFREGADEQGTPMSLWLGAQLQSRIQVSQTI